MDEENIKLEAEALSFRAGTPEFSSPTKPNTYPKKLQNHLDLLEIARIGVAGPEDTILDNVFITDQYIIIVDAKTKPVVTEATQVIFYARIRANNTRTMDVGKDNQIEQFGPIVEIRLLDENNEIIFLNSDKSLNWWCGDAQAGDYTVLWSFPLSIDELKRVRRSGWSLFPYQYIKC